LIEAYRHAKADVKLMIDRSKFSLQAIFENVHSGETSMIQAVHLPIASEKRTNVATQQAINEGLTRLNSLIESGGKIIAQYNVHGPENIPYEVVFLIHKPDSQ
jgi:hypothetical protein